MEDALHLYLYQFFLIFNGPHVVYCFSLKPCEGQEQNYAMGKSSDSLAKDGLMIWMHRILEFASWLERRDENEPVSLSQEVTALI